MFPEFLRPYLAMAKKNPAIFAGVLLIAFLLLFGVGGFIASAVSLILMILFLAVITDGDIDDDWWNGPSRPA